jgi:alanyl-tRNA synthetase
MGETGPCGPNSEIDIDRGANACDRAGHPGEACAVNVDGCERFVELGNLVFIQYNRDSAGKLTPLPMKHVDTGTGLERVTAALQSIETGRLLGNYDIDLFQTIISKIQIASGELGTGLKYGTGADTDISFRAIADHSRAICFLISEGLRPGNGEREYVLRRLIRRAVRHARKLGIPEIGYWQICNSVVEAMGDAYPELKENAPLITQTVSDEAMKFAETLERGLELVTEIRERQQTIKSTRFPGDIAFKLHDTYGFPLDLTQDVVREFGMSVDTEQFERLMDEQRERGRAARTVVAPLLSDSEFFTPSATLGSPRTSRFVGYRLYEAESEVLYSNSPDGKVVTIITRETPFYPEGGGQVGDRGVIEIASGGIVDVQSTQKRPDGVIFHVGRLIRGDAREFTPGARVKLAIDRIRRDAAMLNHSATHILHYALRDILGAHVHQAGSLVTPDRLRFDFSNRGPVGEGNLASIEEEINARIRDNAAVATDEMPYKDAIAAGALAFFGDKYGDVVRVVRMGDFSVELCGGTHVSRTGDVGFFKLESESGVAAGVRRIEAVTGQGALESVRAREKILDEIARNLGAKDSAALDRLEKLIAREKELEKKLRALEQKLASGAGAGGAAAETVATVAGVKVVTQRLDGVDPRAMREVADRIRQKHPSSVVALGSDLGDNKVALLVAVTSDLTSRVKAGDIVKAIAPIVGGTGGGRPDMAQAGGRDASKLDEALARVASIVGEVR